VVFVKKGRMTSGKFYLTIMFRAFVKLSLISECICIAKGSNSCVSSRTELLEVVPVAKCN